MDLSKSVPEAGRQLNLEDNGNLSYPAMEDSQMAVSSRRVGKWYFRERIKKPKVLVDAHLLSSKHPKEGDRERKRESYRHPWGCSKLVRDQVLLKHIFNSSKGDQQ